MESKPLYTAGEVVNIFANPEIEDKVIAKVKLLNYQSTSFSFVLEDNELSKDLNKVYCLELWEAEILESYSTDIGIRLIEGNKVIVKLRVLHTVGQKALYSTEPSEEKVQFQDNFKILPDIDTSYWASRVDGSELTSEVY